MAGLCKKLGTFCRNIGYLSTYSRVGTQVVPRLWIADTNPSGSDQRERKRLPVENESESLAILHLCSLPWRLVAIFAISPFLPWFLAGFWQPTDNMATYIIKHETPRMTPKMTYAEAFAHAYSFTLVQIISWYRVVRK